MQKRPSISTIERGQRPLSTSLKASFEVSARRAFCASSVVATRVLAASEWVTLGRGCASAASLAGALHAVSPTTLAQPAATSTEIARSLDVTMPSEAACVPLQILADKYPG